MEDPNDNTLQRLAQHKWAITALTVVGILVIGTWYFFANYAIVTLTTIVPSSVKKSDVTAEANFGASSQKINLDGTSIVPRATTSLTIATNNQQISTTTSISIPWYGITSKQTTLHPDYNADKIAYRSTLGDPCATYSPSADQLLAYQCSGDSALVRYDTTGSQWSIASLAPIPAVGTVAPYLGGVLGITLQSEAGASLTYITPTGESHYYNLPDGFNYNNMYQLSITTNPTDTTDSRFILTSSTGTIYAATVTDDGQVNYITINAPDKYDPSANQTLCSFRKDQSYCYIGEQDSDSDSSQKAAAPAKILKISFSSSAVKSYAIGTSTLSNLHITNDGTLFGQQYKKLFQLEATGDTYTSREITNNADAAEASDKLYFISQGGVFAYDQQLHESYQLFRSPNIKPSHVIATDSKVFITGKSVNSDYYTYAWKLNSDRDTNYGSRLIDLLPSFPVTGAYGSTDLVGDTINIDPVTGSAATTEDIRQKKQDTLEYLRLLGVDTNSVKLSNP